MEFLEKNLEDIIFKTNSLDLKKRGFIIQGKRFRQLRIGNYGIADMVTIEHNLSNEFESRSVIITVFEFKKNKLDLNSIAQATRYIRGIEIYLQKVDKFQDVFVDFKVVLVGKTLEYTGDFLYLCEYLSDKLDIYTYDYDFDGIKFKNQYGFSLINDGF